MFYFFISIYIWTFFLLSCFFFFPIVLVFWAITYFFDPNGRIIQWISCLWASVLTWANPLWKFTISGKENLPKEACVMIVNHQSMADILAVYRLFIHFKWIPKTELFKVPFVGWNMTLNRYIRVDRGSKSSHLQLMRRCEETIQKGNSIMIFPEGTRSKDGKIHHFKEGAFFMAKTSKVPVVPIVLKGTFGALPTKGFMMNMRNSIKVKVLPPIPYEQFKDIDTKEFAKQMQQFMTNEFENL